MDLESKMKSIESLDKHSYISQNPRLKTTERITYEAEVEVIKGQIGDLEDIRYRLGLSARKMAQLLMVDPSAWTRWTKKTTPVPPHVYRSLQWFLTLQEKNPGFTPQIFLSTQWFSSKKTSNKDSLDLMQKIEVLNQRIQALEHEKKIQILNKENALRSAINPSKTVRIMAIYVWPLALIFTIGIFIFLMGR